MHGLPCMFKVVLFTKTNDLVANARSSAVFYYHSKVAFTLFPAPSIATSLHKDRTR